MSSAILHPGQDEEAVCVSFKRSWTKTVFAHVLSLLLGGIPYLLARWKPRVSVLWTCSSCPLQQGDWILLTQVLSGDVTLVAVVEEVVGGIFPDKYVIANNNDQSAESSDRSLLIENDQKVFRYFFYKYMRSVTSCKYCSCSH